MEESHLPPRPVSLIGDDDSGYHSTKPKGGYIPDQMPSVYHTGFLLKRDDKYRWHRYWCKVDSKNMKFFIFSDSNEEMLVKFLPLETVTTSFCLSQATEGDKENCFILSGIATGGTEGDGSSEEIYFAAYSDVEYQQWHSVMSLITGTRESLRMSSTSFLDGNQWGLAAAHDNTSTSSSNFSSNRESMISTTSSLPYVLRIPSQDSPPRGRSPLEQGASAGDSSECWRLSIKQQQPLPSPPPEDIEQDDNTSVGTIYENIDNLVSQFDSTMQATVQALGQVGQQLKSNKKHKKKDRSLLRQASFIKGSKSHKSKLSLKQRTELEKGEVFSGHLFKRSGSGSWKKKWCVLRGAVFSYSKNMEDVEGREYVVLDAQIEKIVDPKKNFAFTVQLRGLPEPLCFGTEEELVMTEWISRLEHASVSKGDFDWDETAADEHPSLYHSQTSLDSMGASEGHYNVPRELIESDQELSHQLAMADNINSGIYSIPRSLPVLSTSTFSVQGQPFILAGDPYAQYDVPRPINPISDDEAIYDYPENVVDMEIYDYPPDAVSLLPPPPDMCQNPMESNRNSVTTLASDIGPSHVSDIWSHVSALPPPPVSFSSSRPSIAISTTSSDDYFQSARNSIASFEGFYNHPRSQIAETVQPIVGAVSEEHAPTKTTDTSESSFEFGICLMRGYLYKKERFTWNKMECLIRNSFLECQKPNTAQGPSLKLFLPRSIVTPDHEVKRQWAFKVKHPRREGVLQFAAEDEESYKRWIKAFNSAAEIEVQSVNTVDEMRITDLDMQNRWATLERSTLQPPGSNKVKKKSAAQPSGSSNRRNTYSAGDEYMSDTLKRRRKFSWIKNLSKKRGMHRTAISVGQLQNDPHPKEPVNGGVLQQQTSTKIVVPQEERAHHFITEDKCEQFQGYLQVQRKGADNMWVRYWCVLEDLVISCYISKTDLTLALSIQVNGSRVADAFHDCKRDFSFKIWHLESGQCLFFAADDSIEYGSWFKEITKGAEYVVPLDAGISNSPLSTPFYHYAKDPPDSSPSQRSSRSSIASLPEIDIDSVLTSSSGGTVIHKGNLKIFSQNKWKDRYCIIRDAALQIFATSSEKTLLSTVSITGCRVELVNVPNEEVHLYIFRISLPSGKAHMFSASSEQEMYTWAIALQDASHQPLKDPLVSNSRKDFVKLLLPIPANQLSSAICSGYTEVSVMGSWDRYWSVVHSGCLYLYQNHDSQVTHHAIMLKGYSISVGGPRGCKKPCVITLQRAGLQSTFIAVLDQNELNIWFNALDKESRQQQKIVDPRSNNDEQVNATSTMNVRITNLAHGTNHSQQFGQDKDKDPAGVLQHIARKYEKKICKTHRVANMTEQNLKRQQSSLTHFKQELSRLTVKLKELADKKDEHAIKRLKNVKVKLQQVEKIIPYIGKYIIVNRQAEIQTVAILKESCTVEMQRLNGHESAASAPKQKMTNAPSENITPSSTAVHKLDIHLETHLEETEISGEPPTPKVVASYSSSQSESGLTEVKFEPTKHQQGACLTTPPSSVINESEAVTNAFTHHKEFVNQPDNSAETSIAQEQGKNELEESVSKRDSPYATLASLRPLENHKGCDYIQGNQEAQYAEIGKVLSPTLPPKSPSNYAELDFTKMQRSTPISPRSRLNYIQVEFDPKKAKVSLTDDPPSQTCASSSETSMDTTLCANKSFVDDNTVLASTLTHGSTRTIQTSQWHSSTACSPKSRISAMQDAIKIFEPSHSSTPKNNSKPCPPPVKRKPKQQSSMSGVVSSPSHEEALTPQGSNVCYIMDDENVSVDTLLPQTYKTNTGTNAQSVTSGTMTVMERIKVLQKQNT